MAYRAILAVLAVFLLQSDALAQSVGTDKCQCLCLTGQDEAGNGGRMAFLIHESADSAICPIFNDRTCEINDPDTGEKHYGISDLCEPLSNERYDALKSSQDKQR